MGKNRRKITDEEEYEFHEDNGMGMLVGDFDEDEIDLFGNRFLKIKIAQIREGGKANKALIDIIADYFNVKKKLAKSHRLR